MKGAIYMGTFAAALVSIAAALSLLGVGQVPRWAWASEVYKVAGRVITLDKRVTSRELDGYKLRYYQNLREQETFDKDAVPTELIEEQIILERRIETLQDHLDLLENGDRYAT